MRVGDQVMATIFLARLIDHEETWKWKWMVLGALGCINNADFEEISK